MAAEDLNLDRLALPSLMFPGFRNTATLDVSAVMDIGLGMTADVMKLTIEYLETDPGGHLVFSLRLAVDRGDGTVGIHQRSMTFDPRQNAIALIGIALSCFEDVSGRD